MCRCQENKRCILRVSDLWNLLCQVNKDNNTVECAFIVLLHVSKIWDLCATFGISVLYIASAGMFLTIIVPRLPNSGIYLLGLEY